MEATRRPWAAVDLNIKGNYARIVDTITGGTIANIVDSPFNMEPTEEAQANANLIVTAVNAYDRLKADNAALVAALGTLLHWMDISDLSCVKFAPSIKSEPIEYDVVTDARAALEAARGE